MIIIMINHLRPPSIRINATSSKDIHHSRFSDSSKQENSSASSPRSSSAHADGCNRAPQAQAAKPQLRARAVAF